MHFELYSASVCVSLSMNDRRSKYVKTQRLHMEAVGAADTVTRVQLYIICILINYDKIVFFSHSKC